MGWPIVVAREGDDFRLLGKEMDISWKNLLKYNDLHREDLYVGSSAILFT